MYEHSLNRKNGVDIRRGIHCFFFYVNQPVYIAGTISFQCVSFSKHAFSSSYAVSSKKSPEKRTIASLVMACSTSIQGPTTTTTTTGFHPTAAVLVEDAATAAVLVASNGLAMDPGKRQEKKLRETQTLQQGKPPIKNLPSTAGVAEGWGQKRLHGKQTAEKAL